MWYDFMKKEIGNNSKLSEFSFYCRVCKTYSCCISQHKRMAYNAQLLQISYWEDFADENEAALRSAGHFDCPTYRRTHEQHKKSLLNKRLDRQLIEEANGVPNKEDKRCKLTLKEITLTILVMAIVMFGLVGLLYI